MHTYSPLVSREMLSEYLYYFKMPILVLAN